MYNGYVVLFKVRLVRELEKKFSGKHVVVVAQRRILPKPTRKTRSQKQMRPRRYTPYEFFRKLFHFEYRRLSLRVCLHLFPSPRPYMDFKSASDLYGNTMSIQIRGARNRVFKVK